MNPTFRLLGAAAAVAALVLGAAVLLGRPSANVGVPSPSASAEIRPTASAALPELDATFRSPLYGYSVRYPSTWQVKPATERWKVDDFDNFDRALSDVIGGSENFDGTSTPLAPGETFEQWYGKYDTSRAAGTCGEPPRQEAIVIDGASGFLDLHCISYLEAVVVKDRTVFVFTLWSPSSRALFTSMLDTVSLTGSVTACGLLTSDEVKSLGGNPGLGALPSESGTGAETTCLFSDGGGNVIVRVTYTKPGGQAAFDAAKSLPGVEVVNDIGTDAVFDPATKTLYVAKGDAMVAIVAGTSALTPAGGLSFATPYGKLVATRL